MTGGSDTTVDAWLNDGGEATLSWADTTGETGYTVTIYEADGSTVKCTARSLAADSTTVAFTGCTLTLNTSYVARVIAGAGGTSREASNSPYLFSVSTATAPSAFSILGLTGGTDVTQDDKAPAAATPVVHYETSFGAARYEITVYQNDGATVQCPTVSVAATQTAAQSATLSECTSLVANGYYRLLIVARDSGGGSKTVTNSSYRFHVVPEGCQALAAATTYDASGAGTVASPYVLCTPAQVLDLMATPAAWDRNFRVGVDIDLAGYDESNGVTPIGVWNGDLSTSTPFRGVFNGGGYTIRNFSYRDQTATNQGTGFFGYVQGPGQVRNLNLADVNVISESTAPSNYAAALVGFASRGAMILGCSVSGTVTGPDGGHVAGLVGMLRDGSHLVASSSSIDLLQNGIWGGQAGGLVAFMEQYSLIADSYSTGDVTVQFNGATPVGLCGGIAATAQGDSQIRDSYSTGTVFCNAAGGLVSTAWSSLSIESSFFGGTVSGGAAYGEIYSDEGAPAGVTITGSYFLDASACVGYAACGKYGASATAANLQSPTQPLLTGWDSDVVWSFASGSFPAIELRPYDFAAAGGCASHGADRPFAGGSGSFANPYLICNYEQLVELASDPVYHGGYRAVQLMADIDLNARDLSAFPIGGASARRFRGWFNGNGHSISNYTKTSGGGGALALFAGVHGRLQRLALTDVSISGGGWGPTAALAEWADGVISDVYVTGSISGGEQVAGLVSYLRRGIITNSYTAMTVTGSGATGVAGLVSMVGDDWANPIPIIRDSFSVSDVNDTGGGNSAPIMLPPTGGASVILQNDFHDTQAICSGTCYTTGSTGVDTSVQSTYFFDPASSPLDQWDFSAIWQSGFPGALPTLR